MTVLPSTTAVRGFTRTDLSALKFNQLAVVVVTLLAITLMLPVLTLVLSAAMLTGALCPELSPCAPLIRHWVPGSA
ncbi:DUF4395 family protein [Deinococcus malanensis]|uniref:DUF4395 family protein n=1 Tax=Deinococcus malanensis TaxID=1706855 RepID=UPI0036312F6A